MIARLLYHTFHILGITLIPFLTRDTGMRILWFGIMVFLSNALNALFSPGLAVWHIHLIPDNVRADYFAYQGICGQVVTILVTLLSSVLMDQLTGTSYEGAALTGIRFVAYAGGHRKFCTRKGF